MLTMLLVMLGIVVALAATVTYLRRGNSGAKGHHIDTRHVDNPTRYTGSTGGGAGGIDLAP